MTKDGPGEFRYVGPGTERAAAAYIETAQGFVPLHVAAVEDIELELAAEHHRLRAATDENHDPAKIEEHRMRVASLSQALDVQRSRS